MLRKTNLAVDQWLAQMRATVKVRYFDAVLGAEASKMSRRLKWILATVVLLLAGLSAGIVLVLRSDWLREKLRASIVEEVERASGGQATLKSFDFDWGTMTARTGEFTLRGKEAQEQAPLFQADRIQLGLTVLSWIDATSG